MTINVHNAAKWYGREIVFRNLSFSFRSGEQYAILGPNGSGKSTLLLVIGGYITPNKGAITYQRSDHQNIPLENIYQYLAIVAPYLELMEEFTLLEQVRFQQQFRPFIHGFGPDKIIDVLGLQKHMHKEVRNLSSGMRQRLKLALCILSDAPLLLMDEPLMNLDHKGQDWFHELVDNYLGNRLAIVCSNRKEEYAFCREQLLVTDFK
ncbi:MAG: ABC transporter ATP-binding protein [Bacteroidetes bacterium SW_11_45_7]|nr:MAG: ABC transporter ATP-binding protein [Bacteroidetes bacterium SW_11_45_7]